jgi:hypothetical protein
MTPLIPQSVRRAPFQMPDLQMPNMPACAFAILVMLAAAVFAPIQAAEPPSLPTADIVPDVPAKPPVPPSDPAVQARLPGCAVWTDRCVTCSRTTDGTSCSNIGIACQPQAVECLMSEEDAKKLDDEVESKTEKKKQEN